MTGRTTIRGLAVAAVAMGAIAGITGAAEALPGRTAPAAAAAPVVTGLEKVQATSDTNTHPYKFAVAKCPPGKKVVGGGGWVLEQNHSASTRLKLTELEPLERADVTGVAGYRAAGGVQAGAGGTGAWYVQAYALCADAASLPGYHINQEFGNHDSRGRQQVPVGCDDPSRQRVIGGGAVSTADIIESGEVALQIVRASAPGDIYRTQSHEDADGYAKGHTLIGYAICMNIPKGYEVVHAESPGRLSETRKTAVVSCGRKQLLSAGAATSDVAPGNVSFQRVFPTAVSTAGAEVVAVENTPTSANWGFIVAQGVCADRP